MTLKRISICLLIALFLPAFAYAAAPGECVVLLHGLGRESKSMAKLEGALTEAGYTVQNLDYPSLKESIAKLSAHAGRGAEECRKTGARKVHFVAHSLGAIILRAYLKENGIDGLGRTVMITPPNNGSEVAESFSGWPFYRKLYGVAGGELGTGEDSVPHGLGPVTYEVGVIAGVKVKPGPDTLFSAFWIPGPDDGKVSVKSARVDGMQGFVVLPVAHRYAPDQGPVIEQTLHFLETGTFTEDRP